MEEIFVELHFDYNMERTNIIDTTNFHLVENLSIYNHNVYTDGSRYILEECNDCDFMYTEVFPTGKGGLSYGKYLGMCNVNVSEGLKGIFDIPGEHELHPEWT